MKTKALSAPAIHTIDTGKSDAMRALKAKFLNSMSLRSKGIISTALPLAIVVSCILAIHAFLDIRAGKRALVANTQAIVQAMVQDFEKLYALDEQRIAVELSEKLACFENIEFLMVHAQTGDVVYGYHRPQIEFQVYPRVETQTVEFEGDTLLLRTPVEAPAREAGLDYITVQVSLSELAGSTRRAIMMAMVAGFSSILLGLGFAFALESIIARPITELERTANSVLQTGDYSLRAAIFSRDEVGRVAEVFNAMLDKIQFNQSVIEATVAERTAKLHTSERRFRLFLESAPDAIMIVNSHGSIILANERMEQLFGYSQAETLAMTAEKLLGEFWQATRTAFAARDVPDCGSTIVCEYHDRKGLRKDGSVFPADFTVSYLATDGERLMAISVRDITERRLAAQQLSQSQKLESIGQLAAGIAHEINTPIQFIGDNARFLKESFGEMTPLLEEFHALISAAEAGQVPVDQLAQARTALKGTDWDFLTTEIPTAIDQTLDGVGRVAQIVRAMKDFSHPSDAEMQYVDLNRAIESTLIVCRNEWKYVARMETDLEPDLPAVPCHPGEFNQVILNMIINASHAIADALKSETGELRPGEAGVIKVQTRATANDCVEIRISDTGTGIPAEVRSRIFDPFFTTKEVGKGTGQGLAIAHNVVVKKHGGKITVESEPGKGTTFIIEMPLNAMTSASAA